MDLQKVFDTKAFNIDRWEKKNAYYYDDLKKLCSFLIPANSSVLEIGCGAGNLLASVKPEKGMGIDFNAKMIKIAEKRHANLNFKLERAEDLQLSSKYDYIILSDLVGYLDDIEKVFKKIREVSKSETKVIITFQNYLWEPILKFGERIKLRSPQPDLNWLSFQDIENMLFLADFDVIKKGRRMIFPKKIWGLSAFLNKYIDKLPIINRACLTQYVVASPRVNNENWGKKYSVSVVIPARNEAGNIENAVKRVPDMGKKTEIIFVEGNSSDNTWEEINKVYKKYKDKRELQIMRQDGKGKGDAVRKGFSSANGDILMILDADLTVRPEDLPKFYEAIASGRGEFINGSRLVYKMERNAMRFLNVLGNKFFSLMFTWLLGQRFKDTLCGTKVLFKKDYDKVIKGRDFFGNFDPFGDFDLLFGAAKLNLKIVELPIRYQERKYGDTNISRFKHGWILLRMCFFAMKKIKFI